MTLNGITDTTCIWAIASYDRRQNNIKVVLPCNNISNCDTVFIIKVTQNVRNVIILV